MVSKMDGGEDYFCIDSKPIEVCRIARIIGKISALTILQYINYKNEKPIGRVKYALF
jgi:hypothetical protein